MSTMLAHYKPMEPQCQVCDLKGHRAHECTQSKSAAFLPWKNQDRVPDPSAGQLEQLSKCLDAMGEMHNCREIRLKRTVSS